METIIYLIRHSEGLKNKIYVKTEDNLQIQNEKNPLSILGEEKAKKLSEKEIFQDIDVVISSNYVRSISTAKYIAEKNNTVVNIIDDFKERKHGIDSWDELPSNFEKRQMEDEIYKVKNGESRLEVQTRMYNALTNVINKYKGNKIVIVSHATAITFLLMKYGHILNNDFEWNAPDIFQIIFNNNEIKSIKHIGFN